MNAPIEKKRSLLQRLGPVFAPAAHVYWRVSRGVTFGVRGMVIDEDRVLLIRHSYTVGWHLPGGGVEAGETAETALKRELLEEGGIVIGGKPVLFGLYFNPRVSQRDHVALYLIRDWSQPGAFVPGAEITAAEFFPWRDLPEDATAGTRRRIDEALGGADRQDMW